MARIIYSALIDSIRGSIGGTTFQANRYGYTVKHKPNITRPWTSSQKEMQLVFAKAVRAWRESSATTRNNWITWSSTNPQYSNHNPLATLSGFACFVKWHTHNFLAGGSVDTSPLITIPAVINPTFKLILSGGAFSLNHTWVGGSEDWNVAFFLSRPFGVAQNFIGTRTRYMATGTDSTDSLVLTSIYPNKYGALPALTDRIAVDYVEFMESGGAVLSRKQSIVSVTAS